jgi:hypothetical protein
MTCKCPNCNYVSKIEKLIPDKELCKKVMDVTEGLFCAMEDTIHDLQEENKKLALESYRAKEGWE